MQKTLEQTLKEIEGRNISTPSDQKSPFELDQERRAREERAKEAAFQLSKLPPKFTQQRFDDKHLAPHLNKSIFACGGTGTGKTTFMCDLAKLYVRDGHKISFISYPAFIMRLQASFRVQEDNPFLIAREVAMFRGFLIIDDLGAEKLTDFVRQITYYIFNEREQWCLPVGITSNFKLSELDEQIDPRISSRIAGMCEVRKFSGPDRRVEKGAK